MRFLAFEGLDGSGKSTLIQGLKTEFNRRGISFAETREPGGTVLGQHIRGLLLAEDGQAPVARAEALLYQADRAQNVETLIRPALAKGTWVFSDRFAASSLAFQAGGRSIQAFEIEWLNGFATGGLQPDLYVLLDLTVDESLRRLHQRGRDTGQEADRFEREHADFHERVRQTYLQMVQTDSDRWLVLDAALRPDDLLQKTMTVLKAKKWLG